MIGNFLQTSKNLINFRSIIIVKRQFSSSIFVFYCEFFATTSVARPTLSIWIRTGIARAAVVLATALIGLQGLFQAGLEFLVTIFLEFTKRCFWFFLRVFWGRLRLPWELNIQEQSSVWWDLASSLTALLYAALSATCKQGAYHHLPPCVTDKGHDRLHLICLACCILFPPCSCHHLFPRIGIFIVFFSCWALTWASIFLVLEFFFKVCTNLRRVQHVIVSSYLMFNHPM